MKKKLPTSELLRLACIYAETDRIEYIGSLRNCTDPEYVAYRKEAEDFIRQLKAYRRKRWGRTKLEAALETTGSINILDPNDRKKLTPNPL